MYRVDVLYANAAAIVSRWFHTADIAVIYARMIERNGRNHACVYDPAGKPVMF